MKTLELGSVILLPVVRSHMDRNAIINNIRCAFQNYFATNIYISERKKKGECGVVKTYFESSLGYKMHI